MGGQQRRERGAAALGGAHARRRRDARMPCSQRVAVALAAALCGAAAVGVLTHRLASALAQLSSSELFSGTLVPRRGLASRAGAAKFRATGALPKGHRSLAWASDAPRCDVLLASTKVLPSRCADEEGVRAQNVSSGGRLPLLITGTGRSGTKFATDLLQRMGMHISHDDAPPGPDGACSWVLAFKATRGRFEHPLRRDCDYPYFAPNLDGARFGLVLHQVRNPLDVVASRVTNGWLFQQGGYVDRHTAIGNAVTSSHSRGGGGTSIGGTQRRLLGGTGGLEFDHSKEIGARANFTDSERRALLKSLQHWVTWNSFVERIADARYRMEDLASDVSLAGAVCEVAATAVAAIRSGDEHAAASLRLASARFDAQPSLTGTTNDEDVARECPGYASLRAAFASAGGGARVVCPPNSRKPECVNSSSTDAAQGVARSRLTWRDMYDIDEDFAAMAMGMAREYGYFVGEQQDPFTPRPSAKECGFGVGSADQHKWGCVALHAR